jgi:hypothetical protein
LPRDSNRNILVKDCQYYIDFTDPNTVYSKTTDSLYDIYLPTGFTTTGAGLSSDTQDSTLSAWYRGERYGFAQ